MLRSPQQPELSRRRNCAILGTIGGNLLLDTRCNYYNQTEFWRHSIGYGMKKDGDVCLVAPGSPRCRAISSADTVPMLVSKRGERLLSARELFRDDGMNPCMVEKDEVLTEILLPPDTEIFHSG